MRSFLKHLGRISFSFLLFLGSIHPSQGQNYINIDSYGDVISGGIKENNFAFINVEFKVTWSITFETSLYTESLPNQLVISSFQKEFLFDRISVRPGITAGGKYSDGFHFAGIRSEMNYSLRDILSIGFNPILVYYSGKMNFRFQAGSTVNLYKNQINLFIKYGPPVYIMNSDNSMTTGLFLNEQHLKVAAGLQVPNNFNFKYSRVVTSFIYSFGRREIVKL
jgi:hypothetical protein